MPVGAILLRVAACCLRVEAEADAEFQVDVSCQQQLGQSSRIPYSGAKGNSQCFRQDKETTGM